MQNSGQIQFKNPTVEHAQWEMLEQQNKEDEAHKKAHQDELDTIAENEQKLDRLVNSSNNFFFSIRTHNPFELFSDDLMIDINKVTHISNSLLSKDSISIPIKDINKVEVTNDFLFATIEIVNGSQTTTIQIPWLKKNEARHAQAVIQGLMIAYKNELNLEILPQDELLPKIEALGTPVV